MKKCFIQSVLSVPSTTQLSRDSPANAGFVCDISTLLGGTVKGTSCTFESRRQNAGQNHNIKIANKTFEIAGELNGYLGITLIRSTLHIWGN